MTELSIDEMLAWLRVALDEDELVARDAGGRNWGREAYGCVVDAADNGLIVYSEGTPSREQADHIALHDPARVLREVEATRRLIQRYTNAVAATPSSVSSYVRGQDDGYREACLDALRDKAEASYFDRPGYRREWVTP